MNLKLFFRSLTVFEKLLWGGSVALITAAFVCFRQADPLTFAASLIGVTSLLFAAKGHVLGQALIVVFAALYGVISFRCRYYGEMITYLGMTAPIAVASVIAWLRHPFAQSAEVEVTTLSRGQMIALPLLAAAVTGVFYFLLRALGNAQLLFSTLSVFTSFIASALALFRSSFYALAYASNDVVLIVLWVLALRGDPSAGAMVVCFAVFLVNDLYGFVNWLRMRRRQRAQTDA